MALLALLKAVLPDADTELTAAYVDHGLRPAAALEASVVAGLCRRLGVSFVATGIPALPRVNEADLRDARYSALRRLARDTRSDWIATGHTRDDQIETIVFRFLRGSSRGGLGGIRMHRAEIVRPLLALGRAELRSCLRDAGIAWIEDPSNNDLRYTRNRVRHRLIPAAEEAMGSGRLEHLAEVAEIWRCEEEYLESETLRYAAYAIRGTANTSHLDLVALESVPRALRPRVMRHWLGLLGAGEVTIAHLRGLAHLAATRDGSGRLAVGSTQVVREYGRLSAMVLDAATECPDCEVRLDKAAAYTDAKGEWSLTVEPDPAGDPAAGTSIQRQVVDFPLEALNGPLRLRARRAGDAIRTREHGRRKVHDIMIDAGVPRARRASWPVLTSAENLIWVPGLAVAAEMESALARKPTPRIRFAWHRKLI